jgi:hypothetical protein
MICPIHKRPMQENNVEMKAFCKICKKWYDLELNKKKHNESSNIYEN